VVEVEEVDMGNEKSEKNQEPMLSFQEFLHEREIGWYETGVK
jgi:hypothetical protein